MKIVIACDGSKQSEDAVQLAGKLPFVKSEYNLVNVIPTVEPVVSDLPEVTVERIKEFNQTLKVEGQKCIDQAAKLLESYDKKATGTIVEGDPLSKLVEISKTSDLMIVGSRGLNPMKSLFLGSVSDGLLRHSECPIIVYKHSDDFNVKDLEANFTVGYDESKSSKKAIDFLKNFNLDEVSQVKLMSVVELSYYYGMSYTIEVLESLSTKKENLKKEVEAQIDELRKVSTNPKYLAEVLTECVDASEEIGKDAHRNKSSLIVVGSNGKNLFDRIVLGSTSNRLAHHATNPVLIVRS